MHHISTIKRIARRIRTIALQDDEALTPLTILTAYDPHKGYTSLERKQQWGKVEQIIRQIPKCHMLIWCTDANGQLGRINQDPRYTHIIGRAVRKIKKQKRKWEKII